MTIIKHNYNNIHICTCQGAANLKSLIDDLSNYQKEKNANKVLQAHVGGFVSLCRQNLSTTYWDIFRNNSKA